jgi:N-acetylglucosaminyldiphosphoundecaprenol N-acetyl-beta-D-mannosaminyltransferase
MRFLPFPEEAAEVRLMGMPIDALTFDQAIERVFSGIAAGRGGRVLTPNIDILRQYNASATLRKQFDQTELIVTDGMPLVWALRVQGTPVPQRITGTDMLLGIAAEAAVRGASVLLAGGYPGEAQEAAARLTKSNPGLVAQAHAGYIERNSAATQLASLSSVVRELKPDVVFLGLPFVHQLSLMTELHESMPGTWFVGVGSSFEFVNGVRRRAPQWLQQLGLEWAFRLVQQPRFWRRYLLHGLPFAARLGFHVAGERLRRTHPRAWLPSSDSGPS